MTDPTQVQVQGVRLSYEEVDVGHQRRQTKLNNDYHKKEGHWKAQYDPWTIGNPHTESCAKI